MCKRQHIRDEHVRCRCHASLILTRKELCWCIDLLLVSCGFGVHMLVVYDGSVWAGGLMSVCCGLVVRR